MELRQFIRDKIIYMIMFLLISIFTIFFLRVQELEWYPVFFLISGYLSALVIPMSAEFYVKSKFYGGLDRSLNELDKKYYISELLQKPAFAEGQMTYEALRKGNKAMNDEIGKYKLETREYREYIEMWIHEVKTPVASLKLFLENHQSEFLTELQAELNQIDGYLEQVLYYARSSSAEKDYLIRKASLEGVVRKALKQNSRLFIKHRVTLKLGRLDYEIYTDVKWTGFVLTQILVNAIKYTPVEPEVHIWAEEQGENIILNIKDNGIGITKADLPRVFEKGFTGENGRIYGKSTGMGLYICKKLCDKLQLPVSLWSEAGKGTKVQITFMKNLHYDFL